MSTFASLSKCPNCPAFFANPSDLEDHLNSSHRKGSSKISTSALKDSITHLPVKASSSMLKGDPSRFTYESGTVEIMEAKEETVPSTLLASSSKPKKKGYEASVLAAIAECGEDDELLDAFNDLEVDATTGKKILTPEIVKSVAKTMRKESMNVIKEIAKAQCVSICFVVDTTGSMSPHINAVRRQIEQIVESVLRTGCTIGGLAFVGYKDWCDGPNHYEILEFIQNYREFQSFVTKIVATGGGDAPEDVIGGLNKAVQLNWLETSGTRIIFHLCDAPPHGNKYHAHPDSFPNGHVSDRPLKDLFEEINEKKIDYYFGRINSECDKMISIFEVFYQRKITVMNCGDVKDLTTAVLETVKSSVSASCLRSMTDSRVGSLRTRNFTIDKRTPDWSSLPIIKATTVQYQLPENVEMITSFAPLNQTIRECEIQIAPLPFDKGCIRYAFYGRLILRPASSGSKKGDSKKMKSSAMSPSSTTKDSFGDDHDLIVLKEFITHPSIPDLDRQRYMVDLEVQTIASKLAFEFNGRLARTTMEPNLKIKFLMAKVIRFNNLEDTKSRKGSSSAPPRIMAFEKKFRDSMDGEEAKMIKYTNNLNYVADETTLTPSQKKNLKIAIAFSHFTYSFTKGYLLVADLQGVETADAKGSPTLLLTDPAIHCGPHARFGKTNLREEGIKAFFKKHCCNEYCIALGLEAYTATKVEG